MGGMTNNMSYAGGGQVPVQNYFMGGLVKKVGGLISKTPQARLIKFAVNQARKAAVKPPVAKALKALAKSWRICRNITTNSHGRW